jgi:hypothetical protein
MEKLRTIEICELGQIKVNAIKNTNIWDVGTECIALANLLKVAVELHFNDVVIDIYVDTTVGDVMRKLLDKTNKQ